MRSWHNHVTMDMDMDPISSRRVDAQIRLGTRYASAVGPLLYAAISTRLGIQQAVNQLAAYIRQQSETW